MITISENQLRSFRLKGDAQSNEELRRTLRQRYPNHSELLDEESLSNIIDREKTRATSAHLTHRDDFHVLLDLRLMYGEDYDQQDWFTAIMEEEESIEESADDITAAEIAPRPRKETHCK